MSAYKGELSIKKLQNLYDNLSANGTIEEIEANFGKPPYFFLESESATPVPRYGQFGKFFPIFKDSVNREYLFIKQTKYVAIRIKTETRKKSNFMIDFPKTGDIVVLSHEKFDSIRIRIFQVMVAETRTATAYTEYELV